MSKKSIVQLVKMLNSDILPPCLDYSLNQDVGYDINKIQYNTYYKSFEFFDSKFPSGFENLPGYYRIINEIRYNAKTPLEEINDRLKLSNDILNESISTN